MKLVGLRKKARLTEELVDWGEFVEEQLTVKSRIIAVCVCIFLIFHMLTVHHCDLSWGLPKDTVHWNDWWLTGPKIAEVKTVLISIDSPSLKVGKCLAFKLQPDIFLSLNSLYFEECDLANAQNDVATVEGMKYCMNSKFWRSIWRKPQSYSEVFLLKYLQVIVED